MNTNQLTSRGVGFLSTDFIAISVISCVVLGSGLWGAMQLRQGLSEIKAREATDAEVRSAIDRIHEALRHADVASLQMSPPDSAADVRFRTVTGWENGRPVLQDRRVVFDAGTIRLDGEVLTQGVRAFKILKHDKALETCISVDLEVQADDGSTRKISRTFVSKVSP